MLDNTQLFKIDGVFINLTDEDIIIKDKNNEFIIKGNKDFLTPVTPETKTDNVLSGIVSYPLEEKDIHTIQSTQMFNTIYTKIERSERNAILVRLVLNNPYTKHPFTDYQVEQINKISNKRTRLLILTEKDAAYWSSGNFQSPFSNYRLFTSGPNGSLIEYPVPKTYKNMLYSGIKKMIGT